MMLTKTIATKCNPREQAPVTVALAYDGDAAFRAAREVYLGVARSLAGEFEFRDFWWRFDALVEQTLFERAVGIAAEADIVFCCPGNPHVLPRAVQDWICRWLTRRTQPDGALVILLPIVTGTSPSPTLLERDLRETARASGLAYFTNYYTPEHSLHPSASAPAPQAVFGEDLDVVRVVQHGAGVNHWGLNE
jgi:hypothetical protein